MLENHSHRESPSFLLDENLPRGLLPLSYDVVWKKVFRQLKPKLLRQFCQGLSSLFEPCEITKIRELNPEMIPDKVSDIKAQTGKTMIADLLLLLSVRRQHKAQEITVIGHLEIQRKNQKYFILRMLAYASTLFTTQLIKGGAYDLSPVLSVAFCLENITMLKEGQEGEWCGFHAKRIAPHLVVINNSIIIVEVKKAEQDLSKIDPEDIVSSTCYVLNNAHRMTEGERIECWHIVKGTVVGDIMKRLAEASRKDYFWKTFELLHELDEEAHKEAIREEARTELRDKGKAEGKAETMMEMVESMLTAGIEVSKIAEITGLSVDDIAKHRLQVK